MDDLVKFKEEYNIPLEYDFYISVIGDLLILTNIKLYHFNSLNCGDDILDLMNKGFVIQLYINNHHRSVRTFSSLDELNKYFLIQKLSGLNVK